VQDHYALHRLVPPSPLFSSLGLSRSHDSGYISYTEAALSTTSCSALIRPERRMHDTFLSLYQSPCTFSLLWPYISPRRCSCPRL